MPTVTPRWDVVHGDSVEVLARLPDACIDALITDPPAGIGFMGRDWDTSTREEFVTAMSAIFRECLRVMKPGAHGLVWAIPRTSHWTATALEDAGFEIRDRVIHLFGTGFPKSHDVSKSIDKAAGAERKVVGVSRSINCVERGYTKAYATRADDSGYGTRGTFGLGIPVTAPATPEAQQWAGWGTALKPAVEDWILVRKPLIGTVAANVIAQRCGAINIDGCRIDTTDNLNGGAYSPNGGRDGSGYTLPGGAGEYVPPVGRWPAHLVLSHNVDCAEECSPGCAVALLDADAGSVPGQQGRARVDREGHTRACVALGAKRDVTTHPAPRGDSGGTSRFFYCAKASRAEREAGLAHVTPATVSDGRATPADNAFQRGKTARRNTHPTVKPQALMRWLVRLITPPGGVVLDCFGGSGSTGVAALAEGFHVVIVEREAEYLPIIRARLEHALR